MASSERLVMRILVTGAGGMLGKDLLPVLSAGHEVLGLDHAACDITDEAAVRRIVAEWKPELVFNCAAFPDVDGCERDPERAFAVNARGPGNLARAAEAVGARLFHVSTDYVFDGSKRTPYLEDDATGPINVYGQSKLEGEQQVLGGDGERRGDSRHLVLRTSWLFGVHKPNFIEKVMADAQRLMELKVVEDQISCATWTLHLAQRIAELATRDVAGILHVAGSGASTRAEQARYIVGKLGSSVPVKPIRWSDLPVPAKRPAYSAMGSQRLAELGIAPLPHWRTALDDYLRIRAMVAV